MNFFKSLLEDIANPTNKLQPVVITAPTISVDDSVLLSSCSCSHSCGSNFSMNGECSCSVSCGSNYSK